MLLMSRDTRGENVMEMSFKNMVKFHERLIRYLANWITGSIVKSKGAKNLVSSK